MSVAHSRRLFLVLLFVCFGAVSVLSVHIAEAGLGSIVRKAARKADDGAGSVGHKLDIDGLKHLDVEPGVSRFGLATHPDGSLNIKGMDGKELHVRSAGELDAALAALKKNATGGTQARFFVTPEDLFGPGKSSPLLEKITGLHVVTGGKTSLPVSRIIDPVGKPVWGVKIRKGIIATTPDMRSFTEAAFRMNHAFNAADIHVVSFSKKAPDTPDVLNYAKAGHPPKPTFINPQNLDDAFLVLRGKKLIVRGRVDGDALLVKSGAGPAQRLSLRDLRSRAVEANIDLIVLGRKSAAQPGKKLQVGKKVDRSLTEAFKTERYGDFLAALGGDKSPMIMQMDDLGKNHVVWRSMPANPNKTPGLMERLEGEGIAGGLARSGVEQAVKQVSKEDEEKDRTSVELTAKNKHWQNELDGRIISFVSVGVQILFIVNVIAGLLAWSTSSWLWEKVWSPPDRSAFSSRWSFYGIRLLRTLAMIFTLMALFGLILFLVQWTISAWQTMLGILRVVFWPFRKLFEMLTFLMLPKK